MGGLGCGWAITKMDGMCIDFWILGFFSARWDGLWIGWDGNGWDGWMGGWVAGLQVDLASILYMNAVFPLLDYFACFCVQLTFLVCFYM